MGAPTYAELQVISMKANGTVTANRLVKLNSTARECLHTTAITEVAFGVAKETVATGLQVPVEIGSGAIVKLVAAGTIAAGDPLMPDSADGGKVLALSGATAVTCGQAIDGAASGETFTAVFRPGVRTPVAT